MTSTITLYKTPIIPEHNFIIDDIENYLYPLTKITINDFQYIKHDLDLEIKIDSIQSNLEYISDNKYNYCRILNSSNNAKACYYYILKKEWRGQETIKLTLRMDTINTFKPSVDFNFSPKTLIKREHKNRYFNRQTAGNVVKTTHFTTWILIDGEYQSVANWTITDIQKKINPTFNYSATGTNITDIDFEITSNSVVRVTAHSTTNESQQAIISAEWDRISVRNIDIYSEGISPVLYGEDKGYIEQDPNLDWYLIYQNNEEVEQEVLTNPVSCFLTTSEPICILHVTSGNTITPQMLTNGHYYTIVTRGKGFIYNNREYQTSISQNGINLFQIYKNNDKIDLRVVSHIDVSGSHVPVQQDRITDVLSQLNTIELIDGTTLWVDSTNGSLYANAILSLTPSNIPISEGSVFINDINTLDRTDSRIIKVIKLPYSPVKITNDGGVYTASDGSFKYDTTTGFLKLDKLSSKFNYEFIDENIENPFNPLLEVDLSSVDSRTLRSDIYESKLYHSDFYQPKVIYDSFNFTFSLEKVDIEEFYQLEETEHLSVQFVVTSTINSRFLFIFNQYTCGDLKEQDYNNVMSVARNNEISLYNQAYLNYIRTGYNYDVKQKALSDVNTGIGFIAGALNTFSSGEGFGKLITSAFTSINSIIGNEISLQRKMNSAKYQATSVSGSDDIDLMSEYAKNRAKFMIYKVSPKMRTAIYNLFFYTGYVADYQGIPVVNTRVRFNYLQCELYMNQLSYIPSSIEEDIKNKYNEGVTFIHSYDGTWDILQQYENWETMLNIPLHS